jgi:hypothetical protein
MQRGDFALLDAPVTLGKLCQRQRDCDVSLGQVLEKHSQLHAGLHRGQKLRRYLLSRLAALEIAAATPFEPPTETKADMPKKPRNSRIGR